jgi:hypothetical protein
VSYLRDFGRTSVESAVDSEHHALTVGLAYGVALMHRRGGRRVVTMTSGTLAWLLHAARVVTAVHDAS